MFIGFILIGLIFWKADIDNNDSIMGLLILIIGVTFFMMLASPVVQFEDTIKKQCEEAHVSYELVESIADVTGKSEHDIVIFCKYAAVADMDLIDAIRTIDPDLSEEEAAAIVTTSDLKQSKED
jgi:predicted RND superfamily exporter protein